MGAGEQQKQPTVYHEVQLSYPQQPYVAGYPQVQQQQFGAGPGGASNQHITDATPPQPYPYGQSPKPLMYPPAASAMLPTMGTYQQPFAPPPAAGGLAYGPMTISSGQTDGCCPSAAQAASQGPPLKGGPCCCSFGWVLFGLGFLFAPLWIVALFVPCFSVNTKDRGAAIACTVALCCLAAVVLLALFLPLALGGS